MLIKRSNLAGENELCSLSVALSTRFAGRRQTKLNFLMLQSPQSLGTTKHRSKGGERDFQHHPFSRVNNKLQKNETNFWMSCAAYCS